MRSGSVGLAVIVAASLCAAPVAADPVSREVAATSLNSSWEWGGAGEGAETIFVDGYETGNVYVWSSAAGYQGQLVVLLPGGVPLVMERIPAGVFQMGSPVAEVGRYDQEDLHQVTLTQEYWMGKYEVTQAQWAAVMGTPMPTCATNGAGASYPVYCVTWYEVADVGGFVAALNTHLASTSQVTGFRLPSEAEWERAARVGNQFRFSHGDVLGCGDLCSACASHSLYMWWCGDQPNPITPTTQPVGLRLANQYGLHDMHGNVGEWVQDFWLDHLGTSPATDPTGPPAGDGVYRNGNFSSGARGCRSASRNSADQATPSGGIGFRLARTAD